MRNGAVSVVRNGANRTIIIMIELYHKNVTTPPERERSIMASINPDVRRHSVCPHCDCLLSKKALDSHRRLYYDTISCTWIKKRCLEQPKPQCEFEEPSLDDFAFEITGDDKDGNSEAEIPPPPIEFDQPESYDMAFAGK